MIKQIEKLRKQDPESTSYPYWVIVDPTQNMGKDVDVAAAQITGVFFSRADAEDFLIRTRYNFSPRAAVYCMSGCYSEEWCDLYDSPQAV